MESKVISVRVDLEFLEQINATADRLYAKSYTGQPNRSQLILDALRLFCELADMGKFDNANMQLLTGDAIVNSVDKPVNSVDNNAELLEAMKRELLPEIEKMLIKHQEPKVFTEFTKSAKTVNSVDHSATMTLKEAHALAQSRGYKSGSSAFSNKFTKNSEDENYQSHGIARIDQGERKAGLYIDLENKQD